MRTLVQENWKSFLLLTTAAVVMRLAFVFQHPLVQGDAQFYIELAKNMLSDHIYGLWRSSGLMPTVVRLPGYPLFLAACFKLWGSDNMQRVMLLHVAIDVATCFIVADTARRMVNDRAAKIAFALACLCPFTANYVATILTETTSIFATAAAVWLAVIAMHKDSLWMWAASGVATGAAIMLRPDGGLVLISLGCFLLWTWWKECEKRRRTVMALAVLTAVSLAPLVPWTIRNWKTMHIFQPLVTMDASDPDEFVPRGWNRYVTSWIADYSSTEDLTFNVSGAPIDLYALPKWATDSPQQFERVAQLFAEYNKTQTMTPELDAQFGEIARERIHAHPIRFFVVLPVARALDVWFRPRTEMLPLDTHWWEFVDDIHDSSIATALGVANLVLVLMAIGGALRGEVKMLALLTIYPILRTLLMVKMAAVEDRYTLECFPMMFVLAAAYWDQRKYRIAAQSSRP